MTRDPLLPTNTPRTRRCEGLTLVEATFTVAVLSLLIAGAAGAISGLNGVFAESQTYSQVSHRARRAMERLVSVAGSAVTSDAQFAGFEPDGSGAFNCLGFRQLTSVMTGVPIYDDDAKVFIIGPNSGVAPSQGVVIGRGPDAGQVHSAGSGPDNQLGTTDDDTQASVATGFPAVELLVPSTFTPAVGDMLTIQVDTARRALTVTLRLNARDSNNQFVFDNDLVLTERVSLRQ